MGSRYRPVKSSYGTGRSRGKLIRGAVGGAKGNRSSFLDRKRMVVPGYTRTGGSYGRFRPARTELKWLDTQLSAAVDATGEVPTGGQVCLVPQGDGPSARDGNKCTVKSVHLRGTFNLAATSPPQYVYLRLIMDTQCNGAAAAITDVYSTADMRENFRNLNNSDRFKVICKKDIKVSPQYGITSATAAINHVDIFKKVNVPMIYSSTTGALTEIRSNNLFWVWGSDGTSDDTISFTGYTRIRFEG